MTADGPESLASERHQLGRGLRRVEVTVTLLLARGLRSGARTTPVASTGPPEAHNQRSQPLHHGEPRPSRRPERRACGPGWHLGRVPRNRRGTGRGSRSLDPARSEARACHHGRAGRADAASARRDAGNIRSPTNYRPGIRLPASPPGAWGLPASSSRSRSWPTEAASRAAPARCRAGAPSRTSGGQPYAPTTVPLAGVGPSAQRSLMADTNSPNAGSPASGLCSPSSTAT